MSEVGKVGKGVPKPFPVMRKSTDPLAPETGEVEFSQYVREVDEENMSEVQNPVRTEDSVVRDDARRKRLKPNYGKREEEDEEDHENDEEYEEEGKGTNIDIEV